MKKRKHITIDGNEAAASVAYRLSEVIAIYPITPSSNMGELSDEWAAKGKKNLWGTVPTVVEMQSEAGAAGAVHGALQAGALSTTFTASQGLLLMIPNMYKIAGELTPYCMHVAARSLATHALSIFGDHSDVMACRQTGFALMASGSVQEAHDLALVSHAATLATRIPFLHFFDGFRTSHEVAKMIELSDEEIRAMIPEEQIEAHRNRSLSPDHPVLRGTAQNPDCFFQAREACNSFYMACPEAVSRAMQKFGELTGRRYRLFDYVGAPDAERVIIMMGSGAEAAHETVEYLLSKGEKVGLIKVRLYRPFSNADLLDAIPVTAKRIAVLDRTKEPGANGEPLYQDVVTALREAEDEGMSRFACTPRVIGGRYGLSSKEFTPSMVKAVYDELKSDRPKNHFTVGIRDDVTHLSLDFDPEFDIEPADVRRSVFFGLGSDGTVGANKNSIKIIGEETENQAQGYFVYDSKKSGAITISHLRFGPRPIRSSYLIRRAQFVACHQFNFLEKFDVVGYAEPGGTLLLNAPFPADQVWDRLPVEAQQGILDKKLRLYTIDAYKVAGEAGMGRRTNTVMQTCFFAISGVLPRDEAIAQIKKSIEKTYMRKGPEVVQKNFEAVDMTLANLHEVRVPSAATSTTNRPPAVPAAAPDFVQRVTATILAGQGDLLPVSAFPVDGTWPVATSRWEKRSIALEIPAWESDLCIQCNKCALVCPHAAIRAKYYDPALLEGAPETYKAVDFKSPELRGLKYTLQVAPEDCTGCTLCVMVCPAKDKSNPKRKAINMVAQAPIRQAEAANYDFFLSIPDPDRKQIKTSEVKSSQFLAPLFEYSGACAGCGETPYIKLMTQMFGDRTIIANATGCSSIYGGNLPTTPYTTNCDGRGPAWANSLFEDNAEFGLGIRLAVDKQSAMAVELLEKLTGQIGDALVYALLNGDQTTEAGIEEQRTRVEELKWKLRTLGSPEARRLEILADYLVRKNVWILGGDGWAYDIGYGGLDHVLASGANVNILVLDTEVYSNTGGQASKSTPMGAAAKFAAAGKAANKKNLALMAINYGNVYVAQVAMGAKDSQTALAFKEAESFQGPSLIIAYSHCIAHGYDLAHGLSQQKLAVDSAYWPLFRFDPRKAVPGSSPFTLDSAPPKLALGDFVRNETRFRMVEQQNADRYKDLISAAQQHVKDRFAFYQTLAAAGKESRPAPENQ